MFRDRIDAGRQLAEVVASRLGQPSSPPGVKGCVVLGLPRGGVPVAALVADALGARLDVLVVRKIGVPWQPELALGAVGEGGAVVLNDGVLSASGVDPDELAALIARTSQEVQDVVAQLRPGAGPVDVSGRMAIVVDDGVATGATARAAASVLRQSGSGPVILAAPVASAITCESLASAFDEVICAMTPTRFGSVGQYYERFEQVNITEVRQLLDASAARRATS
jgi:putative phosphoribosyl transferase